MDERLDRTTGELDARWVAVAGTKELRRARCKVVNGPIGDVAVFWNDGEPRAMANICIHRERELSRGTIFNGRVICPGHQWAFDVATGFCAERDRTQPIFEVLVIDDVVLVDPSTPVNGAEMPTHRGDGAT